VNKVNIDDLAKEIHLTAKASGFWDEDRNMGEMLMLIVSELAESLEEHRDSKSNFYLSYTGKPEGIVVELADAAIRILDTLYSQWDGVRHGYMRTHFKAEMKTQLSLKGGRDQYIVGENFGENLLRACSFVVRADQNIMWLIAALVYIDRVAMSLNMSLWETAEKKMEYNKTRPYKHGKNY
jgi:hypothetical protein